jgi:glucose-1-phosphate cytidylyltransferase
MMKVVLLAGGMGTRISEETDLRPKPMIEVGGKPILWHIMKHYSHFGFDEFIICLGYKGEIIKNYFANYHLLQSDVTIDLSHNRILHHNVYAEPWKVTLVDTGLSTMTGGRMRRIRPYLGDDGAFCMTYGDGLSTVDLRALLEFHRSHGKLATLTAINPAERFGLLDLGEDGTVRSFREKRAAPSVHVNGGFFVLSPKVLDYIDSDETSWELAPLERLSSEGQLKAYRHPGFWQCMDTQRDKLLLEDLWKKGEAPWKLWA